MKYKDILEEMRKEEPIIFVEGILASTITPGSLLMDLGIPSLDKDKKDKFAVMIGFKSWEDLDRSYQNKKAEALYLANVLKVAIKTVGGNVKFAKLITPFTKKPEPVIAKILS
jgi:hypothetical protein